MYLFESEKKNKKKFWAKKFFGAQILIFGSKKPVFGPKFANYLLFVFFYFRNEFLS